MSGRTSAAASVRPTIRPEGSWWSSTAALTSRPSTGNDMTIEVPSTPPPPIPALNPPAKSWAAARLKGPIGSISKAVTGPV